MQHTMQQLALKRVSSPLDPLLRRPLVLHAQKVTLAAASALLTVTLQLAAFLEFWDSG